MAFGKLPKFKIVCTVYGYEIISELEVKRWPEPTEFIFFAKDGNAALYSAMNLAYYGADCIMAIVYQDDKEIKRFTRNEVVK